MAKSSPILTITIVAIVSAMAFRTTLATAQEPEHEKYVSPWKTPWTYEQSDHWADLDPAYSACSGREQSPIDIRNAEKADLPPLQFESKSLPLKYVINNRHTIRVNYKAGNENFLRVGNERFELTQFHFHHPSEELVNGTPYPMEAHLMYAGAGGKVVGVTVFVKTGKENSTVAEVWKHMPSAEGQNEVAGVSLSPGGLLPADTVAYYQYMGSVTAPPCTEGVTWFVLKTPIELSTDQIKAFAALYPSDVRPVQPLNGRIIKQSR
jgi:carbonic anhydrase